MPHYLPPFADVLLVLPQRLLERIDGGDDLAVTDTFVVSVEGLDGCGKSTLIERLGAAIEGAAVFRTPPSSISSLRPLFDDGNISERTSRQACKLQDCTHCVSVTS